MGQSTYKWKVILASGRTYDVVSTPEDLPNLADFTDSVVAIVAYDFR